MLKRTFIYLHWLFGITAGVVLALMGLTGALYSFEEELIHAIDPHVTSVASTTADQRTMLAPADLLAQIKKSNPYVSSLTLSHDPQDAARVGFMNPIAGTDKKKFELYYLNPYTGQLLGKPASEEFFRSVLNLHRKLMLDDTGKAITGAATLAFLFLLLSGLYLRWPKTQRLHWRTWLAIDNKKAGRHFLVQWHAVLGTCLSAAYLLIILTGLVWSYDWYRSGLTSLVGVSASKKMSPVRGKSTPALRAEVAALTPPDEINLHRVWATFNAVVPHYQKLILLLPSMPGNPVQILYLDPAAAHPYANNRIVIDGNSGALQQHELYAAKSKGEKLMASLYALHSGHFFGITGRLIMLLASLCLPLFALTGWIMYWQRRRSTVA